MVRRRRWACMIRIPPWKLATLAVAAVFAARAGLRLAQPEFNILHFAVLGWPPWALWVVSGIELLGAALILRRATFFPGALLLAGVAGAFVFTYLNHGAPEASRGAVGMLVALAGLVLLRRHHRA